MKKGVVVGIVVIIIIIGIAISIPVEDNNVNDQDLPSEINLEENIAEEIIEVEEEPSGRNLTVELNESLGLSSP